MLVLVMLAIGGLIARMYQLQVVEHEIYTTLSDKNRVHCHAESVPWMVMVGSSTFLSSFSTERVSRTVVMASISLQQHFLREYTVVTSITW